MITARARSSALAHALAGTMRGCAAAFDEPGHSKSRCALDLRTPEYKFHPGRACRDAAKRLRHHADPSLLTFETREKEKSRGSRST